MFFVRDLAVQRAIPVQEPRVLDSASASERRTRAQAAMFARCQSPRIRKRLRLDHQWRYHRPICWPTPN